MKVNWLGHACFLITAGNGVKIITDPYEANYRGIINYGPVKETADIVTISHQHGDHNYTGDIPGKPEVIQGPGQRKAKGIEFTGIPCYHDRVSGRERGENTLFCFPIDGIHVCHAGDLGHPLDENARSLARHNRHSFLPHRRAGSHAGTDRGDRPVGATQA
ncbi:MAG: MBL fold metallo-hydrolase [Chloroflexota bacterium]